jgi:hemoglobin
MTTLYERLGGEAAVEAAVVRFYDKIMADTSLAPFFAGLDMEKQIQKQIAFMTLAFGGPSKYSGRDLRTAHQKLVRTGLNGGHFDSVAGHLAETLSELGVDAATIGEVLTVVGSTRKDVLDE